MPKPDCRSTQPAPHRCDLASDIVLCRDQRRNHQQHQYHSKAQPIDQRNHGRLEKLCLQATLEQQGGHSENSGQRCQHDRPQTVGGAIDNRRDQPAINGVFVDRRYQNDGIVDDDARHPEQTHHREHAQRHLPHGMPIDRADQPEGNDCHHHHRSRPTSENPRQHQKNTCQTQVQPGERIGQKFGLLLAQPRKAVFDLQFRCNARQNIIGQRLIDLAGTGRVVLRDVACHGNQPDPVLAPHGTEPGALSNAHDVTQRDVVPRGRAHAGTVEKIRR